MRRTLNRRPATSLDLLLDTICNAFGSIILIALLIVILSSETTRPPSEPGPAVEKDNIERQIATAKAALAELTAQLAAVPVTPLTDIGSLRSRIQELKAELAARTDASANQTAYVDFSGELARLRGKDRTLRQQIAAAQNEQESLSEREESLREQITALKADIQRMVAARSEPLRLPKEVSTEKRGTPVIFLYNEIFWMYPDETPNTTALEWSMEDEGVRVVPLRGRGISLPADVSVVEGTIRRMSPNRYLTCYVFPDSVEAYRSFRKLAYAAGVEIGWSPQVDISALFFVEDGYSPKPQ